MVYQINTNAVALGVYNNLSAHQTRAASALAKVSSGLKAAGGIDVASTGAANTLLKSANATQTAISSVQNAINTLRVADSIYSEAIALGQLGLEVANRRNDAGADTSAIDDQLAQITDGIDALNTKGTFNGTKVLGTALTPKINNLTAGVQTITVTPGAMTAPATDDVAGYTAFLDDAVDLRAANAGNLVTLQNTLQVLNSTATNELAGMAQAADADIAVEMMNLTSANILTEAATAMLAQSMQLPNSVLKLLQ